eukprot:6538396-Lingulodinium_polyedra.AAC.1
MATGPTASSAGATRMTPTSSCRTTSRSSKAASGPLASGFPRAPSLPPRPAATPAGRAMLASPPAPC